MSKRFKLISLSASEFSVSRCCVPIVRKNLEQMGNRVSVTDIRDLSPVWTNNRGVENYPQPYLDLFEETRCSDGVIFFVPIYCYTASGPAKIVSEILGGQGGVLTRKPVSFIVASGTMRSHLAIRDIMTSMSFEQETFCFPRHVGLTGDDIDSSGKLNLEIKLRLWSMIEEFDLYTGHISSMNREISAKKETTKALESI